jgi:Tfp pilus assembly protein PilO
MKIQENVIMVIKAVVPLFIVVILFAVVGQFGFGKIAGIRDQISTAQSDQKILSQKLDILKNIQSTGAQSSNLVATALPDGSPALSVISQIKILAGSAGVTLSEVKAGASAVDTTGLSAVSITFNVAGSRSQVESFVNMISSFAPVSVVEKIKISESAPGTALANVSIKSFWAPFPTKVPAITTAITDLTAAEKQTLQGLSSLTQPVFVAVQAGAGGKADPFSP